MEEEMGRFLLLALVLIIACLPCNAVMLGLLRRDHPDLYVALGQPRTFGLGPRQQGNLAYLRFLLLRGHRGLGDVRISRLADIQGMLLLGSVAAMLLTGAMVLARQPG